MDCFPLKGSNDGLRQRVIRATPTAMKNLIRIATRTSALARWQAEEVARRLKANGFESELVPIESDGDIAKSQGFETFGYKGVFTKRIEAALLDDRADIAVHSMKDLHSELPEPLMLGGVLEREDPRDALISERYASLTDMPKGAVVGTSSVRRAAIIKHLRPDLIVTEFRGNVPTRLEKLQRGDVDATLLAVAGLKRLGLSQHITRVMPPEEMLPAVAQGAIGIEQRISDDWITDALNALNHPPSFDAISAERAMLAAIDGDCHTPLSGHARIDGGTLTLTGKWYSPNGELLAETTQNGNACDAISIGNAAGATLLKAQKGNL